MTTTEKLNAIKSKCEDDITIAKGFLPRSAGVYLADLKRHIAACESTIAAIDRLDWLSWEQADILQSDIIAAWEGLE